MTIFLWQKRFESLFPGLLGELQEGPLIFESDRDSQASANMNYIGGAASLRERLNAADICSVIESMADRWSYRSRDIGTRVFYAWYDEMAGQLGMSIIKGELKHGLPFGATITVVPSAEPVAAEYLRGADFIGWEELKAVEFEEPDVADSKAYELLVYARQFDGEAEP